jgi:hypothetical protein
MSEIVSALFDTRERCDHAIELLTQEGFAFGDIEFRQGAPTGPVAGPDVPGTPSDGDEPSEPVPPSPAPDVPEEVVDGATIGAASGMAMGAVAAGVGAIVIPGAGLLAAALTGFAVGGAAGGTLGAALGAGLSTPKPTDKRLRDGGFILGVRASGDRRNAALEALTRAGGEEFEVS